MYGEDPSNAMPVRNILFLFFIYGSNRHFLGGYHVIGSPKLEINVILYTTFLTALQIVINLLKFFYLLRIWYMSGTPRDTKMNKTCNLEDIRQMHENLKWQLSKEGQSRIT